MDKVLITGASGYVGSNLIAKLEKENYELHLINRKSSKIKDHNTYCFDINEFSKLRDVFSKTKPDVVIHLAAIGFHPGPRPPLDELIKFNFLLTKKLIDLSIKNSNFRKFIYPTTYMECVGSDNPIRSDAILVPQSDYALSKSLSTNLLLSYINKGKLDATILRLFSVYGSNDLEFRFIPAVFDALINGKVLEVTSCKQKRDFIHITDVVDLISRSLGNNNCSSTVYNVGCGKQIQLADVVNRIKEICVDSKGEIKIGARPDRSNEAMCYYADIGNTKITFNWKPKYDINSGLSETYEHFISNKQ